jgi:hypothetical protein
MKDWNIDIRLALLAIVLVFGGWEIWKSRWLFDGTSARMCIAPDGVHLQCTMMTPGTRILRPGESPLPDGRRR